MARVPFWQITEIRGFSWNRGGESIALYEVEGQSVMNNSVHRVLLVALLLLWVTPLMNAGTIVVANDEWMFGNSFINTNDDVQFAKNVGNFVVGSGSGNILILSSNFGLTQSTFLSLLTSQGYTYTQTGTVPATFAGYDAIFLASNVGNDVGLATSLVNYVNAGGNVFLEAGTGCCGGAAGEAGYWNPFLNSFGLSLANSYNGVSGNIDVSAFQSQAPYGPALFAGVNSVYMNNGNDVAISGGGSGVQIFADTNGNGLFGVYETTAVPEPSSLMLLGSGIAGLAGLVRRKLSK
jgi:hypothetical protein